MRLFPVHAWRRRSVVPEDGNPAHPASPPRSDDDKLPEYQDAVTTAQPVKVRISMKQMAVDDYKAIRDYLKQASFMDILKTITQGWLWKWYAIVAVAIALTVLVTTQKHAVVKFCAPITHTIRSWPGGWLIPIVLLIIVSYPPLVGHEIIGILIGLVWGIWEGFAILAAGTFIGEILLWFSFKWCCTNAAAKFEKKNKLYWSLTQLIREKTFTFVLILRFSAVPGHIVTAVSASARANYWSYLAAAFLTLPKQLTIVYLGEAFGSEDKTHHTVSLVTFIITMVITGFAAVYVYYEMRLVMMRRSLELPTTGVPMTENPTWADVVAAEEAKEAQESKDSTDSKSLSEKAYVSELRKDSATVPAPRGWSVPHKMTSKEMNDFIAQREGDLPVTTKSGREIPLFAPAFGTPSPTSPSRATMEEVAPDAMPSRGQSLELARPPRSARRVPGGRQIADEADAYAAARGGRPGANRERGDSGAALIHKSSKGSEV